MTIKIGAHEYEVRYQERYKIDLGTCSGSVDWSKGLIIIDSDIDKSHQESTLLHEIIEVINILYEVGLDHRQIKTLEETIYQVLVDNKWLRKGLTATAECDTNIVD